MSRRFRRSPLGKLGPDAGAGLQPSGLALVAVRCGDPEPRLRRAGEVRQRRNLRSRLCNRRQGQREYNLLAGPAACGRGIADRLPGARDHARRERDGERRALSRPGGPPAAPEGRSRRSLLQRNRHAEADAALEIQALPGRHRQPQRPRGQEPDVPPLDGRLGRLRRADGGLQGTHGVQHPEPGVLRERPVAGFRARLRAARQPLDHPHDMDSRGLRHRQAHPMGQPSTGA